jgi:hypothetical protein
MNLSSFVAIGQNRAAAFRQAEADHDFVEQETELTTNTQLTGELPRTRARRQRGADAGGHRPGRNR